MGTRCPRCRPCPPPCRNSNSTTTFCRACSAAASGVRAGPRGQGPKGLGLSSQGGRGQGLPKAAWLEGRGGSTSPGRRPRLRGPGGLWSYGGQLPAGLPSSAVSSPAPLPAVRRAQPAADAGGGREPAARWKHLPPGLPTPTQPALPEAGPEPAADHPARPASLPAGELGAPRPQEAKLWPKDWSVCPRQPGRRVELPMGGNFDHKPTRPQRQRAFPPPDLTFLEPKIEPRGLSWTRWVSLHMAHGLSGPYDPPCLAVLSEPVSCGALKSHDRACGCRWDPLHSWPWP